MLVSTLTWCTSKTLFQRPFFRRRKFFCIHVEDVVVCDVHVYYVSRDNYFSVRSNAAFYEMCVQELQESPSSPKLK